MLVVVKLLCKYSSKIKHITIKITIIPKLIVQQHKLEEKLNTPKKIQETQLELI